MLQFTLSVLTSMVGGILLAWLLFLRRQTAFFSMLREAILPSVTEINGIEDFFREAASSFREFEDKGE